MALFSDTTTSFLQHLKDYGWTVVPNFLDKKEWHKVAEDFDELYNNDNNNGDNDNDDNNNDDNNDNNTDSKKKQKQLYFETAKIGHDGTQIQDETTTPFRDVRHSETCVLLQPTLKQQQEAQQEEETKKDDASLQLLLTKANTRLPSNAARANLLNVLNSLKQALQQKMNSSEEEWQQEVLYVYYPIGGYYHRHVDAENGNLSAWRRYSFLFYLNHNNHNNNNTDNNSDSNDDEDDWNVQKHGGQLRLYRDSGQDELPAGEWPNFVDVAPHGGTLVVFESNRIPHQVLMTHRERKAVVGWFLCRPHKNNNNNNNNNDNDKKTTMSRSEQQSQPSPPRIPLTKMEPGTLEALRTLREALPGLKDKLEPKEKAAATPDHTSGLLLGDDDWGVFMPTTDTVAPPPPTPAAGPENNTPDDTDPTYWKSIATVSEQGYIVTLGLAGQRLHRAPPLEILVQPELYAPEHLVTLNLANTDVPITPHLTQILDLCAKQCPHLCQLYLGGNALGAAGLQTLVNGGDDNDNDGCLTRLSRRQLQVLDLRYTDLAGAAAGKCLAALLLRGRLEKLYLEGNPLGDEGIVAMLMMSDDNNSGGVSHGNDHDEKKVESSSSSSSSSKSSCRLRELYLGQTGVGVKGAAALAKSLVSGSRSDSDSDSVRLSLSSLQKLYLEGNQLGTAGGQELLRALQQQSAADNHGAASSSSSLQQPPQLQKLYVDNNGIDKATSVALGAAVNSVTVIGEGGFFQD